MKEKEIWEKIDGFENYEVSTLGRVRSCRTILKQYTTTQGYKIVNLSKKGKHYTRFIHRLVAQTFIPNLFDCREVDHINADTGDNRVENLRWVSSSENKHFRFFGKTKRMRPAHRKGVLQIDVTTGETVKYFRTVVLAAQTMNVHQQSIKDVCKGKNKTAAGYFWKYVE